MALCFSVEDPGFLGWVSTNYLAISPENSMDMTESGSKGDDTLPLNASMCSKDGDFLGLELYLCTKSEQTSVRFTCDMGCRTARLNLAIVTVY